MMVEIDQDTFCSDICNDMSCGILPCDEQICLSQCNTSMQNKLNLYQFDSSSEDSSSSSSEEISDYQAQTVGDNGSGHRRHSHSRSHERRNDDDHRGGRHSHGGRHKGKHHPKPRRHFRHFGH